MKIAPGLVLHPSPPQPAASFRLVLSTSRSSQLLQPPINATPSESSFIPRSLIDHLSLHPSLFVECLVHTTRTRTFVICNFRSNVNTTTKPVSPSALVQSTSLHRFQLQLLLLTSAENPACHLWAVPSHSDLWYSVTVSTAFVL